MKEELFESLVFQWPYLFEKSANLEYMSVREGWYSIIENMCECICADVEQAKMRLNYQRDEFRNDPTEVNSIRLHDAEEELKRLLDELPTFQQVKEKFGSMRIAAITPNPAHQAYIRSAETMSRRTCENCGSPGQIESTKSRGMVCLCESCLKENKRLFDVNSYDSDNLPSIPTGRVAPKFIET